jgi:hypothetical protein
VQKEGKEETRCSHGFNLDASGDETKTTGVKKKKVFVCRQRSNATKTPFHIFVSLTLPLNAMIRMIKKDAA